MAQVARNRGLPTGAPALGWVVSRRPDPVAGTRERLTAEVSRDWKFARDEALEAFRSMRVDRVTRLRRACADLAGFRQEARLTLGDAIERET